MALTSLDPIGFRVGSRRAHLPPDGRRRAWRRSRASTTPPRVVALSAEAWDDLVAQVRTFIHLQLSDELTYERGTFEHLADWDPFLRLAHAGIPIYDPARTDLSGVDLQRTFTMADSDDDLRAFFAATGFLHLRGVFSAEEVAAASAEVDRLAALARPGDDESWWATDADGEEQLLPARVRQPAIRRAGRARARPAPHPPRHAPPRRRPAGRRSHGGLAGAHQGAGADQGPVQHPVAPGLRHGRPQHLLPRDQHRRAAHGLVTRDRQPQGGPRQPGPDAPVRRGRAGSRASPWWRSTPSPATSPCTSPT